MLRKENVILLYGVRDRIHNHAVVLKEEILSGMEP